MLDEFARFYTEGGFFMHAVLLFAVGGMALTVVQLVVPPRFNLGPAIVGTTVAMLSLGLMGTTMGMIMAFSAVASAPPDMKEAMLNASIAIATNPTVFAIYLAILLTTCGSLAIFIRSFRMGLRADPPGG